MAFSQQRFLGATVVNYSASIGLGGNTSQVIVTLVEDDSIGDSFNPQYVGHPFTFQFNNFSFTGILQSYSSKSDTSGFTFEVVLTDPRELLAGVPVILDGYTGSVSVDNLLNVYGYLESFGYGFSQKNDTGIPWHLVRTAIQDMTFAPQPGLYGGPLYFIQSRYLVDLSGLPQLPDDYRIGSDSTTILQFIDEVCDAGGCEYFVSMVETTPGIFVIKVNTQSRTAIIDYNAVTNFLNSIDEFTQKSTGRELANDTTSKFLVGGPVREMWYQYSDLSLNSIWPFWGFDINGYPIIGTGYGNDHTFVLDSRSVNNPRVGPYYQTDVGEIRAVLGGRANWETYLLLKSGTGGIHSNKSKSLGLVGYTANIDGLTLFKEILDNYNNSSTDPKLKKVELDYIKLFFPHTKEGHIDYDQLDIETGYLFEFLSHIANEYYGKKFMVSIPYTYSAIEPDTNKIRVSQIPVQSGFLDENLWPTAIQNNLVSVEIDRFTEEDGKIVCFVRYNNGNILDLSELSIDDVGYNSRNPQFGNNKLLNYSVFVKASVEENIIFLDPSTHFGPRAIITLNGAVRQRVLQDDYSSKQLLVDFLNNGFAAQGVNITTQEYKDNVLDKLVGSIGQDILNYGLPSTAIIPDLAVIPLESQVVRYGPWFSQGSPGKVEYETDDTLVPWEYGGFDAMNLVANAKVSMAISTNQQLEQGEVSFAGLPLHSLGETLAFGGPLITDISVSIGSDGVSTTYKFRRYVKQPRYGLAKVERIAELSRTSQRMRRNFRLASLQTRRPDISLTSKPILLPQKQGHPKKTKNSSHEILVGQNFTDNDGNVTTSVLLQSEYNFVGHSRYDYENKAFMSLDGLFTPFATYTHDSLPSFSTNITGDFPSLDDLNPYKSGEYTNTKIIARDSTLPQSLYGISQTGEYRGLCLKGPVILSGWGYDINDKPTPNKTPNSPSDEFLTDYKKDSTKWPTGPIDLRWDADRGVWAAGGGNKILEGVMQTLLTPGATASMSVWDSNENIIDTVQVEDAAGWRVEIGKYVIAVKINGKYRLLVAEC